MQAVTFLVCMRSLSCFKGPDRVEMATGLFRSSHRPCRAWPYSCPAVDSRCCMAASGAVSGPAISHGSLSGGTLQAYWHAGVFVDTSSQKWQLHWAMAAQSDLAGYCCSRPHCCRQRSHETASCCRHCSSAGSSSTKWKGGCSPAGPFVLQPEPAQLLSQAAPGQSGSPAGFGRSKTVDRWPAHQTPWMK